MEKASRHRWIIRYFIATLSRRTLPLLAKIPLLGHPRQLPTQMAQLLLAWSPVAWKRLLRFPTQFSPPASQDIRPNPQFLSDLADAHAGRLKHRHRFTLVLH
jgi:hypothetical protein